MESHIITRLQDVSVGLFPSLADGGGSVFFEGEEGVDFVVEVRLEGFAEGVYDSLEVGGAVGGY